MTQIAVMQPYFVPYPGYFRLFAEADLFVVYDCVQFPRRGYVHRNQLPDSGGEAQWLTLPLRAAPQETLVRDLEFADDSIDLLEDRRRKFPSLNSMPPEWERLFAEARGPLLPWLSSTLSLTCNMLGLQCPMVHSSSLNIPAHYRGQDRIIEICKTLGATRYLNAPGGKELYSEEDFGNAGIALTFLAPYSGSSWSVLYDLCTDGGARLSEGLKQTNTAFQKGSS